MVATRVMVVEMDTKLLGLPANPVTAIHHKPPLPGKRVAGKLLPGEPITGKQKVVWSEGDQPGEERGGDSPGSEEEVLDCADPEEISSGPMAGPVQPEGVKPKARGLKKFAIIRRIRGLGKHLRSSSKTRKTDK